MVIIIIATFDWNRLKPTINQKVSAELNRPFAIRGDLGVVWERQKEETGWRSWVPWPHVHADDIILGNPPHIPEVTMIDLPRVEATLAPLALLTKTVYLPWIKLQQPDARLIRLSEKTTTGRSIPPAAAIKIECAALFVVLPPRQYSVDRGGSPLTIK
ncbi:AsmA family protein [Shigella flexneri]